MLSFFSSLRLTLVLLLGLALVSVAGTLSPSEGGRYDLFYQSPWFRLLLALLAANMAVCTAKTILRNLRERRRHFETLQSEQVFAGPLRYVLPRDLREEHLAEGLSALGYRVQQDGGRVVARRGLPGRWGSTVVHLSVLAIMLGALSAELGFVGTLNIYSGDKSDHYFDWAAQADRPLGFEFRLDHFEPRYYPIDLRFAAIDRRSGETLELYTVREGDEVALPGRGLSAKVLKFVPEEELLILGISRQGFYLGEYRALGGKHREEPVENIVDPGVDLRPVAFRDPVLRQLHSEVSILKGGEVVRQGVIEVNQPLIHDGVYIYQTAYNRDKFGFWFAGFQFTRDPGKPLVWAGSISMVLGLLLAFTVPYRAVGVSRRDDELLLVALAGFGGDKGAADFDRLERQLARLLP